MRSFPGPPHPRPPSKAMEVEQPNITALPTATTLPRVIPPDSYDKHRNHSTPLIIDNGSTNLRFGFSTSSNPHSNLNVVAKYKERKYNKPLLLFGDGIDAESSAKGQAKTPWEGDVLLNFDALVCANTVLRGIRNLALGVSNRRSWLCRSMLWITRLFSSGSMRLQSSTRCS